MLAMRMPLLLVTVLALALLLAACDTPRAADVATAESVANTAAALAEPTFPAHILTAVAAASPSLAAGDERSTATARPQASARAVPTVAVSQAVMIAAAITHLRRHEAIASGQPEVMLAMPGSAASIAALGLDFGHPDPAGRRPCYLVIVHGDLETSSLLPGGGDLRRPAQYVALLFDLSRGAPGGVTSVLVSVDGSAFRQVLNDPSLPLPLPD